MENVWIIVGVITVIVFFTILYLSLKSTTQVVPEGQRLVIYRLGRFHRVVGPGLVQVIRGTEHVVRTLNVRYHPIEVSILGIFAFGVPNDLTFNLWCSFDLVRAAGMDKAKLAQLVLMTDAERRRQIEVKMREALINQIAELEKRMPLPATATHLDGVLALTPGSERYNQLMSGLNLEMEKILPSIGVILDTTQSIKLIERGIPDNILKAINQKQIKDLDSQRLMTYFDELRKRFPDISEATLLQMLSLIERENVGEIQELLSEKNVNTYTALKTEREPQSSFRSPYIAGLPITNPEMFFGREQILRRIINGLHNNSVIVTGARRIGKTTLLYQIKNRLISLEDPNYYFVPIFVDVQGTSESTFFLAIMNDIVTALSEYLPHNIIMPTLDFVGPGANYSDNTFGRDLSKIIKALQQSQPKKEVKLILLMDEMDVLNSYDQRVQSQLRSIFIRFPQNLRAVVAGVNLDQEWKRHESPFYNMFTRFVLGPFSPEEAQQLIIKPVQNIYGYDEEAIARILAATEGLPFLLQQLCSEIIEHVVGENRKQVTLADVETILANPQWAEEGTSQLEDETLTQPMPTAPTILAEQRAPYNTSTSTHENE
jgi:hypothetical protein